MSVQAYLSEVLYDMQNHLDENGYVKKVTKEFRRIATDSAIKIGITLAEHGEIMCTIHELLKDLPKRDSNGGVSSVSDSPDSGDTVTV